MNLRPIIYALFREIHLGAAMDVASSLSGQGEPTDLEDPRYGYPEIVTRTLILAERELAFLIHADHGRVPFPELPGQDLHGQGVLDVPLDRPLEGAGAVDGIVAPLGQELLGLAGDLEPDLPLGQPLPQKLDLQVDDPQDGAPSASGLKMMTSSTRLRNSGLKWPSRTFRTSLSMAA